LFGQARDQYIKEKKRRGAKRKENRESTRAQKKDDTLKFAYKDELGRCDLEAYQS